MAQDTEEWSAGREPVRDLLEEFFRRYLTRRDLEGTLELVDDGIISIGSGEGEVAMDKAAFRRLLEEEFAALGQAVRFSLTDFIQRQQAADVWNCFCNLATTVTLPDGQQASYPMRVTAVVCRLRSQPLFGGRGADSPEISLQRRGIPEPGDAAGFAGDHRADHARRHPRRIHGGGFPPVCGQ